MLLGSVASVKVPEMAYRISLLPANVLIVATKASLHFIDRAKDYDSKSWDLFESIGGKDLILSDDMEWSSWDVVGDIVLHIELRRWADCVVMAPVSANTLAKMNAGLCDSLLLSFLRAMYQNRPRILCPAMNNHMYAHSMTKKHILALTEDNWILIEPVEKTLACGDIGSGALAPVNTIVKQTEHSLDEWRKSFNTAKNSAKTSPYMTEKLRNMENETVSASKTIATIIETRKKRRASSKYVLSACTQPSWCCIAISLCSGVVIGFGVSRMWQNK